MTPPPRTASVVIVGGGCIGASVAFHLARAGLQDIVLVEAERLGSGSTGRSAGGVRHQFATELNVRLSLESIAFLERFEQETGAAADLRLTGYLMLAHSPAAWRSLQESVALQKSLGVPAHLLTPRECREFVPQLRTDGLLGASFGERDGHAVPENVVQGLAGAARRLGATILEGTPVTALTRQGDAVTGVQTPAGPIAAPIVVLATGAFTRPLAERAGLDIPIDPVRRCVYVTRPFAGMPEHIPMVIDFDTGFYFRREGAGLIIGMRNPEEPPGLGTAVDWAFFEQVSRRAAWVCPTLAEAAILRGWAGLHEDTPDHNGILSWVAGCPGLLVAAGFSGHGFMHSPATGRIAADLVLGRDCGLDLAPLSLGRFAGRRAMAGEAAFI